MPLIVWPSSFVAASTTAVTGTCPNGVMNYPKVLGFSGSQYYYNNGDLDSTNGNTLQCGYSYYG